MVNINPDNSWKTTLKSEFKTLFKYMVLNSNFSAHKNEIYISMDGGLQHNIFRYITYKTFSHNLSAVLSVRLNRTEYFIDTRIPRDNIIIRFRRYDLSPVDDDKIVGIIEEIKSLTIDIDEYITHDNHGVITYHLDPIIERELNIEKILSN